MMKIYSTLIFVICAAITLSCSKVVKKNNNIIIPSDMELINDNYKQRFDGIDSKVRMVVYYDSIICSTCAIKNLYNWTNVINYIESISSESVSILFIFAPKKGQILNTRNDIYEYQIDYPIYLDTLNSMRLNNPLLPRTGITCLIDENGNIIIGGNPVGNVNLWDNYKEQITQLIK